MLFTILSHRPFASVAQEERRTCNAQVVGASPTIGVDDGSPVIPAKAKQG